MKRILFCVLALCFLFPTFVHAEERHWFYMPKADARPVMPPDGVPDPGENAIMIGPAEKRIYLTFDAGYINDNVVCITDILKKEEVPATFFVLKQVILENADLIATWKEAGFLVGNHTYTHPNMARLSREDMARQITDLATLYEEKVGQKMDPFFRPPEGSYNEDVIDVAASLGYRTVFWSAAYADWDNNRQMDRKSALKLLLSRTHPGAVVLLHPTSDTNAAILADYICALKTAGYTFGSLEELS